MRLPVLRSLPLALLVLGLIASEGEARAASLAEVVKAFCLSAYQADLKQQGKTLSLALIDRTCDCVGGRVAQGSDVEDANEACGRPPDLRSVRKSSPNPTQGAIN
ncbi:MAG: hypothetical protein VKK05_08850 [Synechococcus sp.]|nr:hypothetical protein [Synechococcus sp.]